MRNAIGRAETVCNYFMGHLSFLLHMTHMIQRKNHPLLFFLLLFAGGTSAQLTGAEFQSLAGKWEGALTYTDYGTGKPFTLSTNLEVVPMGKERRYKLITTYPGEPQANSTSRLAISRDGKFIGEERVVTVRNGDGMLEIVTVEYGTDGNDNRPATFRHTYLIGPSTFTRKKEVRFVGESDWLVRNEYSYLRR